MGCTALPRGLSTQGSDGLGFHQCTQHETTPRAAAGPELPVSHWKKTVRAALWGTVMLFLPGLAGAEYGWDPSLGASSAQFTRVWRAFSAQGCAGVTCDSASDESNYIAVIPPDCSTQGSDECSLGGEVSFPALIFPDDVAGATASYLPPYTGSSGDDMLFFADCGTSSRGWTEPVGPVHGSAQCDVEVEFDLLEPARVQLYRQTHYQLDGGSNFSSVRLIGPMGTYHQHEVANANSPLSDWTVDVALPLGHYRIVASASSNSPLPGVSDSTGGRDSAYVSLGVFLGKPRCSNGLDDDDPTGGVFDGFVDGADPDCTGPEDISELPDCADSGVYGGLTLGVDNDADGLVDLTDVGCDDAADQTETTNALPCDDGQDNDGDGRVDLMDPGCRSPQWNLENPQCQDGLNNDGQAGIDFDGGASLDLDQDGFVDVQFNPATPAVGAADPQCVGVPWKNKEKQSGCGLGWELTLMLAPFLLRRRRLSPAR